MRAGTLSQRITLEKPSVTTDPTWGTTPGWVTGAEAWASVLPVVADEQSGKQGVQSGTTYEVRLRFNPEVSSEWRVLWRQKVLDIVSVVDVGGRRRELLIRAVEHPTSG